jgi:hypothetical protein
MAKNVIVIALVAFLSAVGEAVGGPSTVLTASIIQQECDANSPAFADILASPDPVAQMSLALCTQIIDSPTIETQRFVTVPSGQIVFRFLVTLTEAGRGNGPYDGNTLHANYKIM